MVLRRTKFGCYEEPPYTDEELFDFYQRFANGIVAFTSGARRPPRAGSSACPATEEVAGKAMLQTREGDPEMSPEKKHPHLRLVWDREAFWRSRVASYVAWKCNNWRLMQERDERLRAERRARKLARQRVTETNNGR